MRCCLPWQGPGSPREDQTVTCCGGWVCQSRCRVAVKMSASTSTVLPKPICRQQWEGVALLSHGLYVCWHFTLTKLQAAMERVVCRLLQQQACNRAVD